MAPQPAKNIQHNNMPFDEWLRGQDRAAATISSYTRDVRLFGVWFTVQNGYPAQPEAVTPTDIRLYRDEMAQTASPATVNRRLAALRAWLDWAVAAGNIDANPAGRVRPVRIGVTGPASLSRQEQFRLVREAERQEAAESGKRRTNAIRNRCLVQFLLNTGLRVSEACNLLPEQVVVGERSGSVHVAAGKGLKARDVPLNLIARRALTDWHAVRSTADGATLWQISADTVGIVVRNIARRAGLRATAHTLRHTFAKRLIESGVSIEKIAALLGHARITTTQIYTKPNGRDLSLAVEKLD